MPMRTAIIPIRSFNGMTRLDSVLDQDQRRSLSIRLAERSVDAAIDAGLETIVLTGDADVTAWASKRCAVASDDGGGLSIAVTNAVKRHARPDWLVLHADLPCIDGDHIRRFSETASADGVYGGGAAIAPSLDGGTNVIAGTGPFDFTYGPGSFHTNLAGMPHAKISTHRALSLEIDTPSHFAALVVLGLVPSLTT
ncbi:MAG: NTP transferase domain-containing protein [Acidimicrobiia bacterium]|nr:NTP transferase domain-containing protein [Acidimicrobiia bacterium]